MHKIDSNCTRFIDSCAKSARFIVFIFQNLQAYVFACYVCFQILDLEHKQGDADQVSRLQGEMTDLSSKLDSLQRDNQYKDQV